MIADWRHQGDFLAAAGLLCLTGAGIELAVRATRNTTKRLLIAGGLIGLLAIVWVELAVGIF